MTSPAFCNIPKQCALAKSNSIKKFKNYQNHHMANTTHVVFVHFALCVDFVFTIFWMLVAGVAVSQFYSLCANLGQLAAGGRK